MVPFPAEMLAADRWVRWDLVARGDKQAKVPMTVSGTYASSTNPGTWGCWAQVRRSKVGCGVGWVLGDGIGCVDLDDCFDKDGELKPWAVRELARWSEPLFVEVSQSGRGLHIFTSMPEGRGTVTRVDGGTVEVYPPDSGRFIALTGNKFDGK